MSKRLEILKNSLEKKNKLFDDKLNNHFETVKQSNGQPLNDKRNGAKTLSKWNKQSDGLRNIQAEIQKTENAIEKEEFKIANIESVKLPVEIKELVDNGTLVQWRKHPNYFFVNGVDRARIILSKNNTVAHRYTAEIPNKEQHKIFAITYNSLAKILNK